MEKGLPPATSALNVNGIILWPMRVLRPRPKMEPPVQVLDTNCLELPRLQHSCICHHSVPISFFSQFGVLDRLELRFRQLGLLLLWWRLLLRCLALGLALNRLFLRQLGRLHFYFSLFKIIFLE